MSLAFDLNIYHSLLIITVDPIAYNGLAQFVDEKEREGLRFVLIVVSYFCVNSLLF